MGTQSILVLCYTNIVFSEGDVEVGTPDNSVFNRKIRNLYPSANVGHIRLKVNLMQVRGTTTTICSHVTNLEPFLNYVNATVFSTMSAEIRAAYGALSSEEKVKLPQKCIR